MQNIDSDLIRGNIDTIILKTMLDEDKYGLDIIKEVENKSNGTYELKQPTLYSCLKRLENQELISSYWLDSDIGGKRHYYKLTEKGKAKIEEKQEEWSKSKFVIDNLLGEYNPSEYRLVKRQDYDKIIEGKKFEYNDADAEMLELASTEANSAPPPAPPTDVLLEEKIVPEDITTAEDIPNQGINETFLNSNADIEQAFYNFNIVPENYNFKESNFLARLAQEETSAPHETEKLAEDEVTVIQQNLLFDETPTDNVDLNNTVDEFEKSIAELASFKQGETDNEEVFENRETDDEKTFNGRETDETDENYDNLDYEGETETVETDLETNENSFQEEEFAATQDFEEDNVTHVQQAAPTYILQNYDENFLEELNELGIADYQNNYDALTDENTDSSQVKTTKNENLEDENENINQTSNDKTVVVDTPLTDEYLNQVNATETELDETPKTDFLNFQEQNVSQTSFEDVISNTEYRSRFEAEYNEAKEYPPPPEDKSMDYKQRLQNLSTYAKNTQNSDEGLKKAKDINSLKSEFEVEGIKVTEFKKEQLKEVNKDYLLSNKLNMVKAFILLFGYIFILSALYIILNSTSFKTTTGFSFNWFLIGFIPFGVYAIYHLIFYIINPYKKVPARYSPGVMLLISAIMTVQLLLITYCVNLQMGFYSFVQSDYNHLFWIIPLAISFAPLVSTGIHCALFYSRNFNV